MDFFIFHFITKSNKLIRSNQRDRGLFGRISIVKLTTNEEKVRKELLKFPNDVKARQIVKELFISKTPLYTALNCLEEKRIAFRGGHNLWYPRPIEKEQPTRVDSSIEKRLEEIRQENLSNPLIAYFDLLFFIDGLPSTEQILLP